MIGYNINKFRINPGRLKITCKSPIGTEEGKFLVEIPYTPNIFVPEGPEIEKNFSVQKGYKLIPNKFHIRHY